MAWNLLEVELGSVSRLNLIKLLVGVVVPVVVRWWRLLVLRSAWLGRPGIGSVGT